MMKNKKKYNFIVGELIEILKQHPKDMPVVVTGYESGYENFYHPVVKKVNHLPEKPYYEGKFQLDENGTNVLVLGREMSNFQYLTILPNKEAFQKRLESKNE